MADQRPLKLQESITPSISITKLKIIIYRINCETSTLRGLILATILACVFAVMALTNDENTLFKNTAIRIILTYKRLEEKM